MVFVLVAGAATRGSRRWIDVGFFTFQPSEFGKVVFVLALAGFVAERARAMASPRRRSRSIGYGLVPIVLVFVQPDIGTALVYAAALAAVLFIAGVRWSHLACCWRVTARARSACCGCSRRQASTSSSRTRRPGSPGSRIRQRSARSDLEPRPVDHHRRVRWPARPRRPGRHPDAARLPAGARDRLRVRLALRAARFLRRVDPVALYLFVVWRGAEDRRERARPLLRGRRGRDCVHVPVPGVREQSAMTMGIAPITGIPLPFVSVGGSSMITNFLALGILQAIYMRAAGGGADNGVMKLASVHGALASFGRESAAQATSGRSASRARASSCRCWRASCAPVATASAVVESSASTGSRRLSGSGPPMSRQLRAARRAGVPIVAITDGRGPCPTCWPADLVRVPPGQGIPVDGDR